MGKGFRALVLAAGRGVRLRPLTDDLPKPLLPVLGKPLVSWTLERLAAAGCEAAAVNLHHRQEDLPATLGERWGELPLVYSRERELLGTLGALAPLREFFSGCDEIVVINGDSLCRWPLRRLLTRHRRHRPAATLLLSSRADPERFGGGVGVDRKGRLTSLAPGEGHDPKADRLVFAGAHILSSRLLRRIPEGSSDFVTHLYRPLVAEGETLRAVSVARPWHDLGTPSRYLAAALSRSRRFGIGFPGWRGPRVRVDRRARVRSSVLEAGVTVAAGARLDRCLVLSGASIGEACRLRQVVVGPLTVVPAGSHIEGRLLTVPSPDRVVPAGSSRVGELVLTPLEAEPLLPAPG